MVLQSKNPLQTEGPVVMFDPLYPSLGHIPIGELRKCIRGCVQHGAGGHPNRPSYNCRGVDDPVLDHDGVYGSSKQTHQQPTGPSLHRADCDCRHTGWVRPCVGQRVGTPGGVLCWTRWDTYIGAWRCTVLDGFQRCGET